MRKLLIGAAAVVAMAVAWSPLAFASDGPDNEVTSGTSVVDSKNVRVNDNDVVDVDSTIQDIDSSIVPNLVGADDTSLDLPAISG